MSRIGLLCARRTTSSGRVDDRRSHRCIVPLSRPTMARYASLATGDSISARTVDIDALAWKDKIGALPSVFRRSCNHC